MSLLLERKVAGRLLAVTSILAISVSYEAFSFIPQGFTALPVLMTLHGYLSLAT